MISTCKLRKLLKSSHVLLPVVKLVRQKFGFIQVLLDCTNVKHTGTLEFTYVMHVYGSPAALDFEYTFIFFRLIEQDLLRLVVMCRAWDTLLYILVGLWLTNSL